MKTWPTTATGRVQRVDETAAAARARAEPRRARAQLNPADLTNRHRCAGGAAGTRSVASAEQG